MTHTLPGAFALEQRIMFDGAMVGDVVDATSDGDHAHEATPAPSETARKEVVIIDPSVKDYQTLAANAPAGAEVLILGENATLQDVADLLAGRSDLDAIHLITHGDEGALILAGERIDSSNLNADTLALIGASLNENGDIMLYGCNVGADGEGQGFIDQVAQMTGADVAASDDLTGAESLGGDWDLEAAAGTIESSSISADNWTSTLAAANSESYSVTLATAQGWTGGTVAGTITNTGGTVDFHNPARANTYMDRYSLTGVNVGDTVTIYMQGTGLGDPFLQIVDSTGAIKKYNTFDAHDDDDGDGLDAVVRFVYAAGDVIRATTYSANTGGDYTLYSSVAGAAFQVAADTVPTSSDGSVTMDEKDTYVFKITDFPFTDGDSDGLYSVKFTSLPSAGSFTLNGTAVTLNQVVGASAAASEISNGQLKYKPSVGAGTQTVQFTVNDGKNDSVASYTMTFTVTGVTPTAVIDIDGPPPEAPADVADAPPRVDPLAISDDPVVSEKGADGFGGDGLQTIIGADPVGDGLGTDGLRTVIGNDGVGDGLGSDGTRTFGIAGPAESGGFGGDAGGFAAAGFGGDGGFAAGLGGFDGAGFGGDAGGDFNLGAGFDAGLGAGDATDGPLGANGEELLGPDGQPLPQPIGEPQASLQPQGRASFSQQMAQNGVDGQLQRHLQLLKAAKNLAA